MPVRAVVWECGDGQTHTHTQTDARDQYTFIVVYDSRENVMTCFVVLVGDMSKQVILSRSCT